ncbi:beta-1,4-galactosyltransferase galt-1-like isoform 2-T3 [Anomaloglossus baeobatrachus]|uniref:beta-1,4-galactosyltransferase galt-1-like isoform X2 n=1 Tax=Anomaloglossus baeobatrachus TaxID=238106 RepID=UPI003F506963
MARGEIFQAEIFQVSGTMYKYPKKILFCILVVMTISFLLGVLRDKTLLTPVMEKSGKCSCCDANRSTDTITALEGNRTFIISPYYDNRDGKNPSMVRILSIIHHQEVKELYCYFCCSSDNHVKVSRALIDMHSDRFGFPYVTTDLLCEEPPGCHAQYLSVHTSPSGEMTQLPLFQIQNREVEPFSANFTVCISTMFGNYGNVLQFIQTIEMYQILGAQRVMIYLNHCSPQIQKAIQYYIARGIVEVVDWPIERHLKPGNAWHYSLDPKDIGYYGQLATLNDCIYRNMYRTKFVLLNDIDEIILPFSHTSWDTMMKSLQQQKPNVGIFLFENHIFPQTVPVNVSFSNISSWKDVPGYNILQYVQREPDRPNYFNARKMILDPRKVIQTSVHSILKGYGDHVEVSLETALVYHCRGPLQKDLPKTSLITDKTIWKHNASLIRNVNKVLGQISFQ